MGCIQPARYGESDMGFYFRHLGYTGQPVKNSKFKNYSGRRPTR